MRLLTPGILVNRHHSETSRRTTMRRRHLTALAIAMLLFVFVWISGDYSVGQMQTTTPSVAFQQSLTQRRAVLTRQQLLRNNSLDQLEFLPRFPFPGPPFPFPELCLLPPPTPAGAIDPHRSLFVHDQPTLDGRDFSLRRTLSQIAAQVAPIVPGTTAITIFVSFGTRRTLRRESFPEHLIAPAH